MEKLKVLVTNDDGYDAPGILALCEELVKVAEVTIVAPLYEQSATGHGITVHTPLRLKAVDIPGAKNAWALQGMPADCVKLGLEHCVESLPDLVISGINRGANLGTDVLYSGTVSGALEAFINNVPAIAVSVDRGGDHNFSFAAKVAVNAALWWQSQGSKPHCCLNINIPAISEKDIKGLRLAKLGKRIYSDVYEQRHDPMGRPYYWLSGNLHNVGDNSLTDIEAIQDGYVSLTPLHVDFTDYDVLNSLKNNIDFKGFGL